MLMVVTGKVRLGVRCEMGLFKPALKPILVFHQLLTHHRVGGWHLVTGDGFQAFPHRRRVVGRVVSPLSMFTWPDFSRFISTKRSLISMMSSDLSRPVRGDPDLTVSNSPATVVAGHVQFQVTTHIYVFL